MNDKKRRFICKLFENDAWKILGSVYAEDIEEAWELARKRFGKVNHVWDYWDSLQWSD